jgi:hypothetical protein
MTVGLCSIQNCLLLVIVIASQLFDAFVAEIYHISIVWFPSATHTNKPCLVVSWPTTTITCEVILTALLFTRRLHIRTRTFLICYLTSSKNYNGIFFDSIAFKVIGRWWLLLFSTLNTAVHFGKVVIIVWQLKTFFAVSTFITEWNLEGLYCKLELWLARLIK